MEFKPVPEPPERLDDIRTVRDAVSRVPQPESDCSRRIESRVPFVGGRDAAVDWLLFLRALGLVESYERGYARTGDNPGIDVLAERFVDRIVLADAVVTSLGQKPVTGETAFDRVRESVPSWERRRTDDWEVVWRDRVRRLLEWSVLFGLAVRTDAGYRRCPASETSHEE